MPTDVDTRISQLLDQLCKPNVSDAEIAKIKDKIAFLRSLKEQ